MKKFKFRLETAAKVRRIEMEQQARALAAAALQVQRKKEEIENYIQSVVSEVKRVKDLTDAGEFSSQLLDVSSEYRAGLKFKIRTAREELAELEKKAEEERLLLVEKEKKRRILEKYKEREQERYEQEYKKWETAQLDEMASNLWFYPSRSSPVD